MFYDYSWDAATNTMNKTPKTTKTGLPLYNDVVERFKRGLRGASGNFFTDGVRLQSYSWVLAERASDGTITWGERMYDKPYGPTTSGHMSQAYYGLRDVVASDEVPQRVIDQLGRIVCGSVQVDQSVATLRKIVAGSTNYYFTYPRDKVFAAARKAAREQYRAYTAQNNNAYMRSTYTRKQLREYRAYLAEKLAWVLSAIDGYEANWTVKGSRFKPAKEPAAPPIMTPKSAKERLATIKREKAILAWHILNYDKRLGYGDRREVKVGEVLSVSDPGSIKLCHYGLHASERLNCAFGYRSGPIITRVLLYGKVEKGDDKHVAQYRECIGMVSRDEVMNRTKSTGLPIEEVALELMGLTKESREPAQKKEGA